jgi:hypothetical protein
MLSMREREKMFGALIAVGLSRGVAEQFIFACERQGKDPCEVAYHLLGEYAELHNPSL